VSVESDKASDEVGDIVQTMGEEFNEATLRFLDRTWSEVEEELSFGSVFRPILTVERVWQGWSAALLSYADDLLDIPLRSVVRLASVAVPVPARLQNRVVRGGDVYQFMAAELSETLLDYYGGNPLPASWTAYKRFDVVLEASRFIKFMDISAGLRVLKGQLVGRIITVMRLTLNFAMAITAGLIIFRLIARANEPGADSDIPTLAQDSKRIGGIRRGQHRVNQRPGPDRSARQ
jgi:hypothetical protein